MIERYGVDNPIYLPWYKPNNGFESKPHKIVKEYLINIGFNPISEMNGLKHDYFKGYNSKLDRIMNPRPDLVLLNEKVIIEIYGDMWHANNQKYNDTDIIVKWGGPIIAKEIREYDLIRKQHLESFGFKVLEIWASEVFNGEYKDKIYNYFYKMGIASDN